MTKLREPLERARCIACGNVKTDKTFQRDCCSKCGQSNIWVATGAPLKTRYAILEPGPAIETDEPIEVSRLASLEWVDCEFKGDQPTYEELTWLLDPLFPDAEGWERVAVNSFKGAADMFVDDRGAPALLDGEPGKGLPVNQLATLVYWTASILHELAEGSMAGLSNVYDTMRQAALKEAADRLTVAPDKRWAPQIHGRAVLFEDRVWR